MKAKTPEKRILKGYKIRESIYKKAKRKADKEKDPLASKIERFVAEYGSGKESEEAIKAKKWDDLGKKISDFYFDDNDNEIEDDEEGGSLLDIGETAARAFGFM